MKSFYKAGQLMFLLGIAELALYSFVKGDIAMTRPRPLPEDLLDFNPALAYISGGLLLISVVAFYLNRYRAVALLTIANIVLWLVTTRHILNLWRDHINGFKTLWLIGGALLIWSSLDENHLIPGGQKHLKKMVWLNLVVLFLFFIDCGIAHFQFAEFVEELIPAYIPFREFFTYFAGVCLLLGGVGILIPQTQRLATLLSGIMIAGWFVLLHVPRALTLSGDEWIGVGESLAVSGLCFMLFGVLHKDEDTK